MSLFIPSKRPSKPKVKLSPTHQHYYKVIQALYAAVELKDEIKSIEEQLRVFNQLFHSLGDSENDLHKKKDDYARIVDALVCHFPETNKKELQHFYLPSDYIKLREYAASLQDWVGDSRGCFRDAEDRKQKILELESSQKNDIQNSTKRKERDEETATMEENMKPIIDRFHAVETSLNESEAIFNEWKSSNKLKLTSTTQSSPNALLSARLKTISSRLAKFGNDRLDAKKPNQAILPSDLQKIIKDVNEPLETCLSEPPMISFSNSMFQRILRDIESSNPLPILWDLIEEATEKVDSLMGDIKVEARRRIMHPLNVIGATLNKLDEESRKDAEFVLQAFLRPVPGQQVVVDDSLSSLSPAEKEGEVPDSPDELQDDSELEEGEIHSDTLTGPSHPTTARSILDGFDTTQTEDPIREEHKTPNLPLDIADGKSPPSTLHDIHMDVDIPYPKDAIIQDDIAIDDDENHFRYLLSGLDDYMVDFDSQSATVNELERLLALSDEELNRTSDLASEGDSLWDTLANFGLDHSSQNEVVDEDDSPISGA